MKHSGQRLFPAGRLLSGWEDCKVLGKGLRMNRLGNINSSLLVFT